MITEPRHFPPLPEIGCPESYYARLSHEADKSGDALKHECAKVGQYITLALDPAMPWDEKLKYFRHALRRHCQPQPFADDHTRAFYHALGSLVRQHAGQEVLRLASNEDDMYAARLSMGQERSQIEDEAEEFFIKVMGSGDACPEWCNEADWQQLKLIRDQWI